MSFRAEGFRRWKWLAAVSCLAGCLVGDNPCGKGQVEQDQNYLAGCICEPGKVPNPDNLGCSACTGAFEEAVGGMCQCITGYRKSGGVCTPVSDIPAEDSGTGSGRNSGTSGQDDTCKAAGDCAGKDATFCMTIAPMPVCLVQDCGEGGSRSCSGDRVCCNLSALAGLLPALGTANGLCIPSAGCTMAGGSVVTP